MDELKELKVKGEILEVPLLGTVCVSLGALKSNEGLFRCTFGVLLVLPFFTD